MELTNASLIAALLTLLNPLIIGLIYLNFNPKATLKQSIADGITICLGSTLIMLVIISIGTKILDFLGVNLLSIRIAGGIILTLSVYQLMTSSDESEGEVNEAKSSKRSVITPFVTPICVGGASISLLFTYISAIPALTLPVFINLGSSVFLVFLIIGAFLPLSVLFFKRIDESILSAVKSISLFIVFFNRYQHLDLCCPGGFASNHHAPRRHAKTRVHCRYTGDLRCEAEHGPSGAVIRTETPLDGERDPEAFGPTDLVAAYVGTCILTVMGIVARRRGWDLMGASVDVEKTMASEGPRRIGHLHVLISLPKGLDDDQRTLLQRAADTCPVKHNLEKTAEIELV